METNYLHEFIAFSKTLNYAQTAETLYLSQPTLRAHIKSLEAEIGAPFVTTKGGKHELTPAGKMFLKKSHEITEHVETALEECRAHSRNSTSLMVGDLGCVSFLEAVDEAKRIYNDKGLGGIVEIRIATSMCSNIESLYNGDADIILFSRIRSDCEEFCDIHLPANIEPLFLKTVKALFWVTKDSPLFDKRVIRAEDLGEQTLLLGSSQNMVAAGNTIRRELEKEGVSIGVDSCPFNSYLEYFVSGTCDTFGITHELSLPTRPGVKVFDIEGVDFLSDLYALTRVDDEQGGLHPFFNVLRDSLVRSFA